MYIQKYSDQPLYTCVYFAPILVCISQILEPLNELSQSRFEPRMRPEPGRKLKLKVNIRDRDFFPETVEQEDIDVIAFQTNADCLVMFPEKISILHCSELCAIF